MRVAVVGAGLAGLSVCFHLIEKGFSVTLFEKKGPGKGASGVAAGLLHPYVGLKGLRSQFAAEAIEEGKKLLQVVEKHSSLPIYQGQGIYRILWENPPQEEDVIFQKDQEIGFGLKQDAYLISSGTTVFIARYLEALLSYLEKKGLDYVDKEILDLKPIPGFNHTVFALGAGLRKFSIDLPIQYVKGQILSCAFSRESSMSVIGKGHISLTEQKGIVQIGSSYEHDYQDDLPDIDRAIRFLEPRIKSFFPYWDEIKILDCYSGIRVARKNGYLPFLERLDERLWLLAGMGSRGLLYGALYGRNLANLIESAK